jgi:hypothetical protein
MSWLAKSASICTNRVCSWQFTMLIRAEDEDGRPTNHVCCDAPASIHPADVSARCIQPPRIHPTLLPPTRPLRVSHVHSHSFAYKQSFQCKSGDARSCLKSCSCNTFSRHYHDNAASLEAVCVYVPRMTAHQCRRHIMLHEQSPGSSASRRGLVTRLRLNHIARLVCFHSGILLRSKGARPSRPAYLVVLRAYRSHVMRLGHKYSLAEN